MCYVLVLVLFVSRFRFETRRAFVFVLVKKSCRLDYFDVYKFIHKKNTSSKRIRKGCKYGYVVDYWIKKLYQLNQDWWNLKVMQDIYLHMDGMDQIRKYLVKWWINKITWHNGNVMGVVMIVSTFAHNLKYHNKSLFLFYISMIWASTFYYKLAT
jgi:hypothetical protein